MKQINLKKNISKFNSINELKEIFNSYKYDLILKRVKKKSTNVKHDKFKFNEFKNFDLIFQKK